MTHSTDDELSLQDFRILLEQRGAELARWPSAERVQAARLLEVEPQAVVAWQAAQQVEDLVRRLPSFAPSAELMRRVAEIPARYPHPASSGLRLRWWLPSLAALLSLGAAAGAISLSLLPELDAARQESAVNVGEAAQDDGAEWDEGAVLALGDPALWDDEAMSAEGMRQ